MPCLLSFQCHGGGCVSEAAVQALSSGVMEEVVQLGVLAGQLTSRNGFSPV